MEKKEEQKEQKIRKNDRKRKKEQKKQTKVNIRYRNAIERLTERPASDAVRGRGLHR